MENIKIVGVKNEDEKKRSLIKELNSLTMEIEGLEYTKVNSSKNVKIEFSVSKLMKITGHYNFNNGVVAFCDEKGNVRIGAATTRIIEILEVFGFTQYDFWVPMSNQQDFVDKNAQQKWTMLKVACGRIDPEKVVKYTFSKTGAKPLQLD